MLGGPVFSLAHIVAKQDYWEDNSEDTRRSIKGAAIQLSIQKMFHLAGRLHFNSKKCSKVASSGLYQHIHIYNNYIRLTEHSPHKIDALPSTDLAS